MESGGVADRNGSRGILDRWITSGGQLILVTNKEWRIRKPRKSGQPAKEEDEFMPGISRRTRSAGATLMSPERTPVAAAVTDSMGGGRILYRIRTPTHSPMRRCVTTDNAVWIAARASGMGRCGIHSMNTITDSDERREMLPLIGTFPDLAVGLRLSCSWHWPVSYYMLGTRRRFGRPIEELPIARTSPIEAVEALGGLFETARARVLSVRTIHQYLNLQLTALFGYAIDLSNPAVRERIASRSSLRTDGAGRRMPTRSSRRVTGKPHPTPNSYESRVKQQRSQGALVMEMPDNIQGGQPLLASLKTELARVIEGQENVIESLMVALVAGGHVLIEGVPGVAKTLTARSLAAALSATFSRIQFTPDLMPADITGVNIFEPGTGRSFDSVPAHCLPTSSSPTKSIARRPRHNRRCSRRCRRIRSASTASRTRYPEY